MKRSAWVGTLVLVALVAACGDDDVVLDGGVDAGSDASPSDGGVPDAANFDAGECPDEDGDGVGALPCGTDCDDADATRYPGATELCDYGGHDEDCDGTTYGAKDDDGDAVIDARCCNGTTCGLDCDDTRGGAHPGVPEVCNRRDDDCNGVVDEDSQVPGFADLDRDLYGDTATPTMACAGTGLSVNMTDCDDSLETGGYASPAYEEVAGDGLDNDCDGTVDESGGLAQQWFRDADGDGFGLATDSLVASAAPAGYTLRGGDCDDEDGARSPGTAELCNGVDDDCNGLLDFAIGVNDWEDDDGDGFVDAACGGAADDCDDGARATHPGAVERCDGRDNDCDGVIDGVCGTAPVDGGVLLDGGAPTDAGAELDGGAAARMTAYIKASNTGTPDRFGGAVSLSADGTRLAVAAHQEASVATGIDGDQTSDGALFGGAVYVFAWSGTAWAQEAYIKASNTEADDFFGAALSLSADGSRLAVGATGESSSATGVGGNQADNTATSSGAVYVFSRSGTTWTQEAYVKASNTDAGDAFGSAVSLSADGSRLAVGAPSEGSVATGIGGNQADDTALGAGAVYVFSRALTTWSQEAYVKAANTDAGDGFGGALSLSSDGALLAVGAPWEDSSATGVGGDQADDMAASSGAAYVFSRAGTSWTQQAYLKASNAEAGDELGGAVSLSSDGTRLAVGARAEDSRATGVGGDDTDNRARISGAAYVYSRAATTWTQEAYVKASNTAANDEFGGSLSLSADGSRLVVAARYEDSSATGIGGDPLDNGARDSGAAYVFSRSGTAWTQGAYVKPLTTDADDFFGWSVSLSADGTRTAVGAFGEDSSATGIDGNQADNGSWNSGAAYLY